MKNIWNWIWELPQKVLGYVLLLILLPIVRYGWKYRDVYVFYFRAGFKYQGMQLGDIIILGSNYHQSMGFTTRDILEHEYGHKIQSMIIGPWAMIAIYIPSFTVALWRILFARKQLGRENHVFEYTASQLGSFSGIYTHYLTSVLPHESKHLEKEIE